MKEQNYKNHRKFSVVHHFLLLPLLLVLTIVGAVKAFGANNMAEKLPWLLFSVTIFLLLVVQVFLRQHYALGLQNRIVRLEFRLRYFELMGQSASLVESGLSFGQIAALRFAHDEEFILLLKKTLSENLSPKQIKESITQWKGDYMRV